MHPLLLQLKALLLHPMPAALGAAIGAGVAAFFNVPAFFAILVLVACDFISGVYKAKITKKTRSCKFGKAGERVVYYILLFVPLRMFSMINPMFDLIDDVIMGIFLSRELLSILENLKVISIVLGRPMPVIDKIIHWVGIDVPLLLEEALPHAKCESDPEPTKLLSIPSASDEK